MTAPNDMSNETIIATCIPEDRRLGTLPHYFGPKLTSAEFRVYDWMGMLCASYRGGHWDFFALSNGGFYMAPSREERFAVEVPTNGYEGTMSADAAGITACLFAFCDLASDIDGERFVELFHQLREFALDHAEASEIFRAID